MVAIRPNQVGRLKIRSQLKHSPHVLTASSTVKRSGGRFVTCREIISVDLSNRPYFVGNLTRCIPENFPGLTSSNLVFTGGFVGSIWNVADMEQKQVLNLVMCYEIVY